ncbi:MAG: hypothetical protein FWC03_11745 [Treponema sp.]|nr:hypothetical protein [Treponema sp.]MCL2245117.1 hypothetical protein [Treponema sp.]
MRAVKTFFSIVLFLVALVCFIMGISSFADPDTGIAAGIIFFVITGFSLWLGISTFQIRKIKHEPVAESDNSLIISYEDQKGAISERTIEIDKVYKKGKYLYVDAYCFLCGDNRTFRIDRILTMKNRFNDNVIEDIESFLFEKYKKD